MKICLVSLGLEERNRRLQPWRYLLEIAGTLARSGHDVCLVSDGYSRLAGEEHLDGLRVVRLSSLRDWPWCANPQVVEAIEALAPDVVLWHLGLTSLLHLSTLKRLSMPTVGVFTSPIYRVWDLLRLGLGKLVRGWRLSAVHVLGSLVPRPIIKYSLRHSTIERFVVESETTGSGLVELGISSECVYVARPGIDREWFESAYSCSEREQMRKELGFQPQEIIVGYFGSPAPLRGLVTLLKGVAAARQRELEIKVLVLSRHREGELSSERRIVEKLMGRLEAGKWVKTVGGFLPRERLLETLTACDVIALPFELVPSDVPLSVLEAIALGMPLLTTEVACLPELVPADVGICVPPGRPVALAEALERLTADVKLRERLGKAGREQATKWNAMCLDGPAWQSLLGA